MPMNKLFPEEQVLVTRYFDIHQDWYIPIPGFMVMRLRRDVPSLVDFSEEEYQEFMILLRNMRKGLKSCGIEEVCMVQNESSRHGVFHLWIMPIAPWMLEYGNVVDNIPRIVAKAKEEFVTPKQIDAVKEVVQKMKIYMSSQNNE